LTISKSSPAPRSSPASALSPNQTPSRFSASALSAL
jgi:hypothetical protein